MSVIECYILGLVLFLDSSSLRGFKGQKTIFFWAEANCEEETLLSGSYSITKFENILNKPFLAIPYTHSWICCTPSQRFFKFSLNARCPNAAIIVQDYIWRVRRERFEMRVPKARSILKKISKRCIYFGQFGLSKNLGEKFRHNHVPGTVLSRQ